MKKLSTFFSAFLVVMSLAACGQLDLTDPASNNTATSKSVFKEAFITLPWETEPRLVHYQPQNGNAIFEGDIIIGEVDKQGNFIHPESFATQGAVENNDYRLWPNPQAIPYTYDDSIHPLDREAIEDAIEQFHEHTSLRFVKRTNEYHYIVFRAHESFSVGTCNARSGRYRGYPEVPITLPLTLDSNGNTIATCELGSMVHEIGHAIGLHHEHSRPDRDAYIKVNYIDPENPEEEDGDKWYLPSPSTNRYLTPYDPQSVMHYIQGTLPSGLDRFVARADGPLRIDDFKKGCNDDLRGCFSAYDLASIEIMYHPNSKGAGALYRFKNPVTGDSLLTLDPTGGLAAKKHGYIPELKPNGALKVLGRIEPTPKYGTVPLYRKYSSFFKDNILTIDRNAGGSYYAEKGIVGYVYKAKTNGINLVPVYRFRNSNTGDHLFTRNIAFTQQDYGLQGVAFYIKPIQ